MKKEKLINKFIERKENLVDLKIREIEISVEKLRNPNSYLNESLNFQSEKINENWSNRKDLIILNKKINNKFNSDKSIIDFNDAFDIIINEDKLKIELILDFAEFSADWSIKEYLQNKIAELNPISNSQFDSLTWNIAQRDFVRLIYGLFQAKILKNKKNEITFLVEEMAKRLDYPLKASWRQNHSNAMNKSNSDFDPTKIFDRIKFGFEAYEKQHISKPKK